MFFQKEKELIQVFFSFCCFFINEPVGKEGEFGIKLLKNSLILDSFFLIKFSEEV